MRVTVSHPPISKAIAQHHPIEPNNTQVKLVKGDKGTVFIPHIDGDCNLSWSNDGGLENPHPVNIKGESGDATVTPLTNMEIENILRR